MKLIENNARIDTSKQPKFIFAFSDKQGENRYEDFVKACKDEGYNDKVIYLNDDYQLK